MASRRDGSEGGRRHEQHVFRIILEITDLYEMRI